MTVEMAEDMTLTSFMASGPLKTFSCQPENYSAPNIACRDY